MEVSDALTSRFSCRAFAPRPLEKDTLAKIIEAARHAPSWANTQPWELVCAGGQVLEGIRQEYLERFHNKVERTPDIPMPRTWPEEHQGRIDALRRARLAHLGQKEGDHAYALASAERNYRFFDAPAVLYLCMHSSLTSWSILDMGMMAQSLMLAATHYGVQSVPAFNLVAYPDILHRRLEVPGTHMFILGIALGYEDAGSKEAGFRSSRRETAAILRVLGL